MSAIHLATRHIQARTAGLTGPPRPLAVATGAPSATTMTEAMHAIKSEAGSLHYLFDQEFVIPVSTAVESASGLHGPSGGRVLTPPMAPAPSVGPPATPNFPGGWRAFGDLVDLEQARISHAPPATFFQRLRTYLTDLQNRASGG